MTHRHLMGIVMLAVVAVASVPTLGQAPPAGAGLRTAWGEPDLRGVWRNETTTPLERPKELGSKEFYSDQEIKDLVAKRVAEEKRLIENAIPIPETTRMPTGFYNRTWQDNGTQPSVFARTSMVIGPEGRIPYTAAAAKREAETDAHYGKGPYNSWMDLDAGERCLSDGLPGSVWTGTAGGPTQILQGPGYVVIQSEQFRDRRIVPTDGRPHSTIRSMLGEGRGHWEGNTLVVDTTNFRDLSSWWWLARWREPTETMHMVERFTRTKPDELMYQLTMEDPAKFTKPWTAEVLLTNLHQPFFEYACHEGNYGLVHSLAGERGREMGKPLEDTPPAPVAPPR